MLQTVGEGRREASGVADFWGSDRRTRRIAYALGVAGVCLIASGGAVGSLWVIGVGVWLFIASILIDLIRRP